MTPVFAVIVISQCLDHAAIANAAMTASVHHPLQLGAQGRKLADASINFDQMSPRKAVGLCARLIRLGAHRQQIADGVDLKP